MSQSVQGLLGPQSYNHFIKIFSRLQSLGQAVIEFNREGGREREREREGGGGVQTDKRTDRQRIFDSLIFYFEILGIGLIFKFVRAS